MLLDLKDTGRAVGDVGGHCDLRGKLVGSVIVKVDDVVFRNQLFDGREIFDDVEEVLVVVVVEGLNAGKTHGFQHIRHGAVREGGGVYVTLVEAEGCGRTLRGGGRCTGEIRE